MSLIDKTIDEIIDDKGSLNSILLKTKVLASRLGSEELADWVRHELDGYGSEDEVPKYRVLKGRLLGTVTNGYTINRNRELIPPPDFRDVLEERMNRFTMRASISNLETLRESNDNPAQAIAFPLPPQIGPALASVFSDDVQVIDARINFDISAVNHILSSVRSKLLDFLLELQKQDIDMQAPPSPTHVDQMASMIIIGNNNQLNNQSGGSNTQTLNVGENDKAAFRNELRAVQVPDEDIEEILSFMDEEGAVDGALGPKTKGWMQKMLTRAMDGSWQIGIGAAGGVLGDAIQGYLGMGV